MFRIYCHSQNLASILTRYFCNFCNYILSVYILPPLLLSARAANFYYLWSLPTFNHYLWSLPTFNYYLSLITTYLWSLPLVTIFGHYLWSKEVTVEIETTAARRHPRLAPWRRHPTWRLAPWQRHPKMTIIRWDFKTLRVYCKFSLPFKLQQPNVI